MSEREVAGSLLASLFDLPARLTAMEGQVARILAELEALRLALPPQLVSVQDAAERLGVSTPTIRRLVKSGRLPSVRVGNSVRVDLSGVRPVDHVEVAQLAWQARTSTGPSRPVAFSTQHPARRSDNAGERPRLGSGIALPNPFRQSATR